jgi:hemerythrin-like domain-containing protein
MTASETPVAREQQESPPSAAETGGVDAIELLASQHREVEALFAELEKTGDRAAKARLELVAELAVKIEGHAKIEETLFYPEGREVDEDTTLEAYEEHDVVRHVLRKLQASEPTDESFMAKATVLKELIEHHVKEEEGELFPKMRAALGGERLVELGAEMQEKFERLTAAAERRQQDAKKMPAKRAAATRKTKSTGKRTAKKSAAKKAAGKKR